MKLSKKISFIVLAFVILNSSLSQEIYFDTYGHESGITQASGLDFSQDKQGFIWVATFDGVNRFGKSVV